MNASARRTAKKLNDCRSFRGEDFDTVNRHAKRFTSRARRRADRALVRDERASS